MKHEDSQLNKLRHDITLNKNDSITKRIASIGFKNLKSVTEHDLYLEAEQERIKLFSAKANMNDTTTLLNMGNSPKADKFKQRMRETVRIKPIKVQDSILVSQEDHSNHVVF